MTQRNPADNILRSQGSAGWQGVPIQQYKDDAEHWSGVTRMELVAEPARPELNFHVRYFEIAPQGFSSKEKHAHEHVVMVVRGEGAVDIDGVRQSIHSGDIVHIRSWQIHQFLNPTEGEPLGFYCIVPADRDRPIVDGDGASSCELPNRTSAK